MRLEELSKLPEARSIQKWYEPWLSFMEKNVEFWLKNSEKHTKLHCARVLLYALLIGRQKNLAGDEMEVLAQAAVFHDSRRQDDWLDVGHGGRAAAFYAEYCRQHSGVRYDERTQNIIAYHDQNDTEGIAVLEELESRLPDGVLLYRIFKDADGLDRFRLGADTLDVTMLRTQEAKGFVDFARELVEMTENDLI